MFDRQRENELGITGRIKRCLEHETFASSVIQQDHNGLVVTWGDGSEYVILVEQTAGRHEGIIKDILGRMKVLKKRLDDHANP